MKKILLTIAITIGLITSAMAQSDGFFNDWKDFDNRDNGSDLPELPNGGLTGDQPTPLGGGLLILTALGAGYAVSKRRTKN
ncbi:MAG: hypothetical protein MJ000_04695 [Bacteroidales bacterium]|nr:hypothetical protein [Bacteroidales bacterium]